MDRTNSQKDGLNKRRRQRDTQPRQSAADTNAHAPHSKSPENILALQSTIGNQATVQLLRANPRHRQPEMSSIMRRTAAPSAAETLSKALALYAASGVARTELGKEILDSLRTLSSEDEIGFEELEPDTAARSRSGYRSWGAYDIAVNDRYKGKVILAALRLVHEGLHAVKKAAYVDEELAARELQIDFYRELLGGIIVDGIPYLAVLGMDPEIEKQMRWQAADQLVDFIIAVARYERSLELDWINKHYDDWGGLPNRWRTTKAAYLKRYLDNEEVSDIRRVLDILESESDRAGLKVVLKYTGDKHLYRGLERIRTFFETTMALYSDSYYRRIRALQDKFGYDFGIAAESD